MQSYAARCDKLENRQVLGLKTISSMKNNRSNITTSKRITLMGTICSFHLKRLRGGNSIQYLCTSLERTIINKKLREKCEKFQQLS